MNELIFLVEEDPEGGYNAKALGENIFTQGDTMKELKEMIKDAVECHFDSPEQMPKMVNLMEQIF
jgi:predicted RNase H-like HicB family nuclease